MLLFYRQSGGRKFYRRINAKGRKKLMIIFVKYFFLKFDNFALFRVLSRAKPPFQLLLFYRKTVYQLRRAPDIFVFVCL